MATNSNNQDTTFIPFLAFKARFSTMMLSPIFTRKSDGKEFRKLGFWDAEGLYTECSIADSLHCPNMATIKENRKTLMVADKTVLEVVGTDPETSKPQVEEKHYYTLCGSFWEEQADNEGWD